MQIEPETILEKYSKKPDSILMRFAELSLKKSNRSFFKQQLKENIERQLTDCNYDCLLALQGGFLLKLTQSSPTTKITKKLRKTAGLAWLAPGWSLENKLEAFAGTALEAGGELIEESRTFGVKTHRSNKQFSPDSLECNRIVGGKIEAATGLAVDLDDPDWKINLHILDECTHLFFHKIEGFRGLPVGSSGQVLALLSGGIDSPVAALRAFRRGCRVDFLHFYAYSSPQEALDNKIRELVEHLAQFGTHGKLFLVPDLPFEIGGKDLPEPLRTVLFRRHIMRVAQKIARKNELQGLVTGESLGQVASQTIENLTSIATGIKLPILRPLIGLGKEEIVAFGRQWGTYDLSVQEYKDCCAIQASNPKTRTNPKHLSQVEAEFELNKIDAQALEQLTRLTYSERGLESVAAGTGSEAGL